MPDLLLTTGCSVTSSPTGKGYRSDPRQVKTDCAIMALPRRPVKKKITQQKI
jgi:hypothetical protein